MIIVDENGVATPQDQTMEQFAARIHIPVSLAYEMLASGELVDGQGRRVDVRIPIDTRLPDCPEPKIVWEVPDKAEESASEPEDDPAFSSFPPGFHGIFKDIFRPKK